ncbi:MAG: DUF5103 domain-containing protein [Cyclobacteriaceae bacterium]|nr:DUF5103 domain-containing protein [Cyclobacteriaceae bacterium]
MRLKKPSLKPDQLKQGAYQQQPGDKQYGVDDPGEPTFDEYGMNIHGTKAFDMNDLPFRGVTSWVTLTLLMALPLGVAGQKVLRLEDAEYEPQIRTVLLYSLVPGTQGPQAVTKLEAQQIVLEFDDLVEDRQNYYARLIHCNHDWTKSTLRDLEILRDYNEFPINDFGYSINTHIPYVHYRFAVPPVKLPGNYVLVVYRDGDKNDIMFSRRFIVHQSLMTLIQEENMVGLGNLKSTNQALNFRISYARMEVLNPASSVHVVIRQNYRWDNARKDVKASFIREDLKQLEYRFFDMDHSFSAGNEFRFVDFRSLNSPGINTERIERSSKPFDLYVTTDGSRQSQAYTQFPDMNGLFVIENFDYRIEPWLSSNYLYVNFTLRAPKVSSDVFVIGAFNGWQQGEENRLTWSNGAYTGRVLLKQGFYNYQYWVPPASGLPGNHFEGDFFQTENMYEVLVYYRPFQPNADLLVGYFQLPVNPR